LADNPCHVLRDLLLDTVDQVGLKNRHPQRCNDPSIKQKRLFLCSQAARAYAGVDMDIIQE
jgi:hypothetical protein